ncbi:uncharacterized protein LOC143301417 [Babylonia areolata]|uniref:uncharacterized protein LOC143301417 n=1 Tax=Babylonia areolata TaxID=304850 RepID=UPI003FD4FCD6
MACLHGNRLFLVVLSIALSAVHVTSVETGSTSSRHKRNSETKVDLDALKDNLATIEDGLSNFQKRSCAVGLNSHHCAIAHLDDVMMGTDYLSGGFSPGKRNTPLPEDIRSRAEVLMQNLNEQKQAVSALRSLLNTLGMRAKQQEKRTCLFRLGNHCLTEALDRAANQYYYLQSHLSPGRRRRQATLRGPGSNLPGTAEEGRRFSQTLEQQKRRPRH